jgi:hypothetical protein
MVNLKSAHESFGKHSSLNGLTVGTRLTRSGLRVVRQPHHEQFVIYAVPDDIATAFDGESRLTLGDPKSAGGTYGNYFGATFYIAGRRIYPVALLRERVRNDRAVQDPQWRRARPAAAVAQRNRWLAHHGVRG